MEMGNISYNRNLDASQVDKCVAYLNTPFEPRKVCITLCNLKKFIQNVGITFYIINYKRSTYFSLFTYQHQHAKCFVNSQIVI